MTRCGIGPRFSIITVMTGLVTGWFTHQYPSIFKIQAIPPWCFWGLGSILVVTGTALYVLALNSFNEAYRHKELVTQGPYAWVRHPIYSAWIILICPGIVLFFQSWLMWLLPLVAYLGFKASIHLEDAHLEERFGQAYLDYRTDTNELFP